MGESASRQRSESADEMEDEEQFRVAYPDNEPGVCGLANLGNTCFMNSALQCLASIPQLVEFFISGEYHSQINKSDPKSKSKGQLAIEFGRIIQEMWSGEQDYIFPRIFKAMIIRINQDFGGYRQQDSQELLTFLLDGLHDDLNRVKLATTGPSQDQPTSATLTADDAWLQYKSKNDSIITDLMHGQLVSTLTCEQCGDKSVTYEPFCYLSVPLPVSASEEWRGRRARRQRASESVESANLDECLAKFVNPEVLERKCSKCGGESADKIINIWRLPEVLIVHLKRYQITSWGMLKLETTVNFPIRNYRLNESVVANPAERNHVYDLVAVNSHSGSLGYGHYTAGVWMDNLSQWYMMNDSHFSGLRDLPENVSDPDAYLLFYRKRQSLHPSKTSISLYDRDSTAAADGSSPSDTDQDTLASDESFDSSSGARSKEKLD